MQNSTSLSKKTIYLIRHGQTDFNKQGIVQGSGIDSNLNDEGLLQAEKFYNAFNHIPFHKIYVTELKRTHQTVAPFNHKNIPIEIIPEFNEINWGIFEGKLPTPENTQTFLEILKEWRKGNLDHCIENGESPNQMFKRQSEGLNRILANPNEENILICMHGRAMRSFLCLLTNTELNKMDDFEHANVCLYVLEQSNDHFKIITHNYLDHLK